MSRLALLLALALSAWWSRERAECEIPVETIRRGRVLARNHGSFVVRDLLLVLSDLAGDALWLRGID